MAEDEALELEEHRRLLYVAMTRAMERLIVAGIEKGERKENCWHLRVERALAALGAEWADEPGRPRALVYRGTVPERAIQAKAQRPFVGTPALPGWAITRAPPEARPPTPLAPSAIAVDDEAAPPSAAMRAAALRGTLTHQLLERLVVVQPASRAAAAERWLERSAGLGDPALRAAIVGQVCGILSHPDFSPSVRARLAR